MKTVVKVCAFLLVVSAASCLSVVYFAKVQPASQGSADESKTSNPEQIVETTTQNAMSHDSKYEVANVLIRTSDNAKISAMVVRKKGETIARPAVLQFTIYVRDQGRDLTTAQDLVDRGYVAVVAYTRGKRDSDHKIDPYEHESKDVHDVIDWISKQEWCNGKVGMYGGSYNGFAQWAATKNLHPALKTIVPYVAAGPALGWPMENNVFINSNYEWSFFVGNNKTLDHETGSDRQRFKRMQDRWWNSGVAYEKMDDVDGQPNRWFQKWIDHPAYDEYWQNMVPYQQDFADIEIPVLSIDGYYNDSQNSGLYYLREHYKYLPEAEHYLVIGPYSHFGAQSGGEPTVGGHAVDPDALFNIRELTFEWLDYVLKDKPKPEMLKDKINYQVMGLNEWRSAPSLDAMSNDRLKLFLSNDKTGKFYSLQTDKPLQPGHLEQKVDYSNRDRWANTDYYPDPVVLQEVGVRSGFNYISQPLEESMLIAGSFSGQIDAIINKLDFDVGVTLYEVTPDNQYFHLSYFIGRASFAKDRTRRQLLTPDKAESIPFSNTRLVCKKLSKGSRLLVHLNVNKNAFAQLNYGSGKDVSKESVKDAGDPVVVKWLNTSHIEIPVFKN